MSMFVVLSAWQSHYESSLGSTDDLQNQVAIDPQTKSTDLGSKSAFRLLSFTLTIAIYHASFRPVPDSERGGGAKKTMSP